MSHKKQETQKGLASFSIMTVKEVSLLLRIPTSTIYDLAGKGKIRGVKFGKHWRFVKQDVESYLLGICAPFASFSEKRIEKRQTPRLKTLATAQVQGLLQNKENIHSQGMITNMSQGGLCFVCAKDGSAAFEIGDPVGFEFELPEASSLPLRLKGRVVHQRKNGAQEMGVKFRLLTEDQEEVIRHYVG